MRQTALYEEHCALGAKMVDFSGWEMRPMRLVDEIASTGYTRERGFELFLRDEEVFDVWRDLVDRGAIPCGLAARSSSP